MATNSSPRKPRNPNLKERAQAALIWAIAYSIVIGGSLLVLAFILLFPTILGWLIGGFIGLFAPFIVNVIVGMFPTMTGVTLGQIGGTIGFVIGLKNVLTAKVSAQKTAG